MVLGSLLVETFLAKLSLSAIFDRFLFRFGLDLGRRREHPNTKFPHRLPRDGAYLLNVLVCPEKLHG